MLITDKSVIKAITKDLSCDVTYTMKYKGKPYRDGKVKTLMVGDEMVIKFDQLSVELL